MNALLFSCFLAFTHSCPISTYALDTACVSSCPTGFVISGTICAVSFNPVIDITLSKIQDTVPSAAPSPVTFSTGTSTAFYPSPGTYDPTPSFNRGYYFTSSCYMLSSSLSFSITVTLIFYIRHMSDGAIMKRSSMRIFSSNSDSVLNVKFGGALNYEFAYPTSTSWKIWVIKAWTDASGDAHCSLTYPPAAASTLTVAGGGALNIPTGQIYLGADTGSFNGFLYRFQYFTTLEDVSSLSITICASDTSTNCLWSCDFLQYLSGSACTNCYVGCSSGCRNSGHDCSFCANNICSGCNDFETCTGCKGSVVLTDGQCSCGVGESFITASSTCVVCHPTCATCSGTLSNNCKSCYTGATLTSFSCVCNAGYYLSGSSCLTCDPTCLTCNGGASNNCLTCKPGLTQSGSSCACSQGNYFTGSACASCHITCLTCSGASATACSACKSGLAHLADGSCSCGAQKYYTGATCSSCDASCDSCSGSLSTNCDSCFTFAVLQADKSCLCNNGYYLSTLACAHCDPSCFTCTGGLATQCLLCLSNASKQPDGSCFCNSGFYWDGSSCAACDPTCLTCTGLSTSCDTCKSNAHSTPAHACICNDGYYWASSSCTACDVTCSTCSGGLLTSCVICKPVLTSQPDHSCTCGAQKYFTGVLCDNCDPTCLTCSGSLSNNCLSCLAGSTIQADHTCRCNDGLYWDGAACSSCQPTCLTCNGGLATDCATCYSNAAKLVDSSCACNARFFWTGTGCAACDPKCTSCTLNANHCSGCVANANVVADGSCMCVDHFYWDGIACSPCDATCLRCTGPLNTHCASCDSGKVVTLTGTCECPVNSVVISGICVMCDGTCATCSGPGVNDCISCKSHAGVINGACVCNIGWIWDSRLLSCMQCNAPHSKLMGLTCTCEDRYYFDNYVCRPCDSSCLTCVDAKYYRCLSCEGYLLEGVCVKFCPLGYFESVGVCALGAGTVAQFEFSSLGGTFFDTVQRMPCRSGENGLGYPYLDSSDPIPSFERGLYFTGKGSFISFPTPTMNYLMLGVRFFISLWLSPTLLKGHLFHLSSNSKILLSFDYQENSINSIIKIKDETKTVFSGLIFPGSQWNHLVVNIEYSSGSYLYFTHNKRSTTWLYLSEGPFIDNINSVFSFGKSVSSQISYQGFLYMFEIYASSDLTNRLSSIDCNGCPVCLASQVCIPYCNLTSFLNHSSSSCISCSDECDTGCRNKGSCKLCYEKNCKQCKDFSADVCVECESGFELSGGKCENCPKGMYYEERVKGCTQCFGGCETCNMYECFTCINNSSLNDQNICECDAGYYYDEICVRKTFTAFLKVSSDNSITLIFTEQLSNNLSADKLNVSIDSSPANYTLAMIDASDYKLTLLTQLNADSLNIIYISFNSELTSLENSILAAKTLSAKLYSNPTSSIGSEISSVQSMTRTGAAVGFSLALGSSALSLDPVSFFNFLNIVEIFSYIVLYKVETHPILNEFLSILRVNSKIPNLYSSMIYESDARAMNKQFSDFEYKTNLLLLNSGVNMTICTVFLVFYVTLSMLRRLNLKWRVLKEYIPKIQSAFVFKAFLRLWLQSCLEISCSIFVGILYTGLDNATQILDFSVCIILMGLQVTAVATVVVLIVKHSRIDDEQRLIEFHEKYGTIFEEFRKTEVSSCLFYLIFVLRRHSIILAMFFIASPIVQLCISLVFSISIPIYLCFVNPYVNKLTQTTIIIIELLTTTFYAVLYSPFTTGSNVSTYDVSYYCIYLVVSAIGVTLISSVLSAAKKCYQWRQRRKARASNKITPIYAQDTTANKLSTGGMINTSNDPI